MSTGLVRILVAGVLILHGLGHLLPALPLLGFRLSEAHSSESWLLTGPLGLGVSRTLGVMLNLLALGGFLTAGLAIAGFWVSWSAWEGAALMAAGLSLLALVLYWNGYPFLFPNKVGVGAVDLFVVLSIFWLRWPPALFPS